LYYSLNKSDSLRTKRVFLLL